MFEFEQLIQEVTKAVKADSAKQLAAFTKEFNSVVQSMTASIWVSSNCADIIFINLTPLGTADGDISVNNYVLQPGGVFGVMGNNAEINVTQYNVVFNTGATSAVAIKKLYTKQ